MLFKKAIPFILTAIIPLLAKDATDDTVRVVPVAKTPEPTNVSCQILFPSEKEIEESNKVQVRIRLDGYPLGFNSEFDRKNEIFNSPEGQSLHVFVDDRPYFAVNTTYRKGLDNRESYFTQSLDFALPYALADGMHVIRVFPVRSYNESLKSPGCYSSRIFYIKQMQPTINFSQTDPTLTFNEPQGSYDYKDGEPILLDFYLTNCELSRDGYKVRLTIDGTVKRTLFQWVPYYIYGLEKGKHTVRLELLAPSGALIPGAFNNTMRTITVQ